MLRSCGADKDGAPADAGKEREEVECRRRKNRMLRVLVGQPRECLGTRCLWPGGDASRRSVHEARRALLNALLDFGRNFCCWIGTHYSTEAATFPLLAFRDSLRLHPAPRPTKVLPTINRVVGSGTTPGPVTSTGPI